MGHVNKKQAGSIVSPQGFKAAGLHSKVKRKRKDLGVIVSEKPANVAAVYTLNKIQAAPLTVTKESIAAEQKIQAVVVNSGNANACTGKQGMEDAYAMRETTAATFDIDENHVAVASTGIIGLKMPMDKITPNIKKLSIGATEEHAASFGESILTTDTFPKSTSYEAKIGEKTVTIAGAAKGSGMIEPNMGTMLAFITTDANIESDVLQAALKEVVDETFNCVTVDGDTSTNDMVIVLANGLAEHDTLTPTHPDWPTFMELLKRTCEDLAKEIARDGEGATKLIEVIVDGAESNEDAKKVAKAVVGSSLLKSAVFGTDANWGRIIGAVGYSGAEIDPDKIDIAIGDITLLKLSDIATYSEEEATAYLENDTVQIFVNLHLGEGSGKAWGCDLTYDYVRINASYRS